MKKSSFMALCLGTVSFILFAMGMCMTLQPLWNAFDQGVILGVAGIILALITVFIWRRMENKTPVHISGKLILTAVWAIAGVLVLGVGMCFSMVFGSMMLGIVIGLIGIIMLLSLIPMTLGLR